MNDKELLNNKDKMMPGGGLSWHKFKEPDHRIFTGFRSPIKNFAEVVISSEEVTALCPLTGFPDQYKVVITYVPNLVCVESKSMKFYLGAFRDYPGFLETIGQKIYDDFTKAIKPEWAKVYIEMNPRGGVKIAALIEGKNA